MRDFGVRGAERARVVYVGDNLRKDIKLGKDAGVFTCWSEFSLSSDSPALRKTLSMSPKEKIVQNSTSKSDLRVRPDVRLKKFSDLIRYIL